MSPLRRLALIYLASDLFMVAAFLIYNGVTT